MNTIITAAPVVAGETSTSYFLCLENAEYIRRTRVSFAHTKNASTYQESISRVDIESIDQEYRSRVMFKSTGKL